MHIVKAEYDDKEDSEVGTDHNLFWPRLLQNKLLEKNQVIIDWDRYIDEDEEDEKGGFDMSALDGGMGIGGMDDFGGLDNYGDMGDMDSDEEDNDVDVKSNIGDDKDDKPEPITE